MAPDEVYGCAGTLTAMSGSLELGRLPYKLNEEATATLPVPQALPAAAKDVTFSFAPRVGRAPTSATTIDVQG